MKEDIFCVKAVPILLLSSLVVPFFSSSWRWIFILPIPHLRGLPISLPSQFIKIAGCCYTRRQCNYSYTKQGREHTDKSTHIGGGAHISIANSGKRYGGPLQSIERCTAEPTLKQRIAPDALCRVWRGKVLPYSICQISSAPLSALTGAQIEIV